jgi:hypothetical protein
MEPFLQLMQVFLRPPVSLRRAKASTGFVCLQVRHTFMPSGASSPRQVSQRPQLRHGLSGCLGGGVADRCAAAWAGRHSAHQA